MGGYMVKYILAPFGQFMQNMDVEKIPYHEVFIVMQVQVINATAYYLEGTSFRYAPVRSRKVELKKRPL